MVPPLPYSIQLPLYGSNGSWKRHQLWTALTLLSHLVLGHGVYPEPSARDKDTFLKDNTPTLLFHSHLFLCWENLLRVFVSTAGLAWPSFTPHLNLFVSNVWVVDVGIHTTETSLQLSLFFPPTWWNHHLWGQGQDPHNYNLNLSLLHFLFSHPADAQYLILPSQLVIFFEIREKTPVSTLQMGTISDFFSIISGFGTMQVHSQCQHFLIGESFLSSVMHFLVKFDSSFSRLQCRLWSG